MATLRLTLSGLIGFVPNSTKKRVRVLLIDGRYRHQAPGGEELFPHFPFLHFRMNDLAPESPRRAELTSKGFGLSFVNYEDLAIKGVPASNSLDFSLGEPPMRREPVSLATLRHTKRTNRKAANTSKASDLPPDDLRWIMPIDGIVGRPGDKNLAVHHCCFVKRYVRTEESNLLAGRLSLVQGRLYVRDFRRTSVAGESLNQIVRFASQKSGSGNPPNILWEGMIATKVVYEVAIKGDRVIIGSMPFLQESGGQAGSGGDLILRAREEASNVVEVNLWNAPFSDLLDLLADEKDTHYWQTPTGDVSLRSFFCLCNKPPLAADLPEVDRTVTVAAKFQADYSALKNVGCPTGLYAEHPRA